MFSKSSLGDKISFYLGSFLFLPGLYLQFFPPRHLLRYDDISVILMLAGGTLWHFGTYRFVPLTMFASALILDLIPQVNHQVFHTASWVLVVFGVALGSWGAWQDRQAKVAQKKLN